MIVLAGKGHEDYQEINGKKYHMDEREIVAGRPHNSLSSNKPEKAGVILQPLPASPLSGCPLSG